MPKISVIVPTHNPKSELLEATLAGLRGQSLPLPQWELVVVDNASTPPLQLDLSWHPQSRLISEPKLGLVAARIAGFAATHSAVVVLVDDDNVLRPDYLEQSLALAALYPRLGTWSGSLRLQFQDGAIPPPPAWRGFLAERHCSADSISRDPHHHESTPWGAGMCLRREVVEAYVEQIRSDPRRLGLDLQGGQLIYGGDTDMAYVGCALGYDKGVFSRLALDHLIPASRCSREYLIRAAEGHGYSEVLHAHLREGHYSQPRPAWREWVARLRLPPEERAVAAARARGIARARREFGP